MSADVFSQDLKLLQVVSCFVNLAGQVDLWRFSLVMKNEGTFSLTDRSLQTEDGLQHVWSQADAASWHLCTVGCLRLFPLAETNVENVELN